MLMGMEAATEDHINHVHNHHDHHHDHGHHHEHAHDHFDSFVIKIGEVDGDKLQSILKKLLAENNIFRAKGFAALPGKPMRQVLQAVGERLDVHFDRLWTADEPRGTNLVFIGKDIEKAAVQAELEAALVA
jgi:cobalamin biosynthesis protein CobW